MATGLILPEDLRTPGQALQIVARDIEEQPGPADREAQVTEVRAEVLQGVLATAEEVPEVPLAGPQVDSEAQEARSGAVVAAQVAEVDPEEAEEDDNLIRLTLKIYK